MCQPNGTSMESELKTRCRGVLLTLVAVLLFQVGSTASAQSVAPLFTTKDVVFDRTLIGFWEGDCNLRLQKSGENAYEGACDDIRFDAHLVRLGKFLFFDVTFVPALVKPVAYKFRVVRSSSGNELVPLSIENTQALGFLILKMRPDKQGMAADSYGIRLINPHFIYRIGIDPKKE